VGEARFSVPIKTGPRAHPASYTKGTGSFPGVEWLGRGIDHPTPPSAEVEGRVKLYIYLLWVLMACSRVTFTFYRTHMFMKVIINVNFT